MRNKFNYNELVKVDGMGKIYGKVKNKLGFIIEKDQFFEDYHIDLIFGNKDWFNEKDIKRILGTKKNEVYKYQIRLCTTQEGYKLIENNIKKELPISNNKLGKISLFKNFTRDGKKYKIIGWSSVFWPVSNKSIQIIEKTIKGFRKQNIPYQYIVMNEEKLTDIRIDEFTENDSNVNVFLIERKIKTKNLKEPFMW